MKKNLFVFIILCCLSLITTSCDKEDSGGLVYTVWNGYKESGLRVSIHFKEDNQCIITYQTPSPVKVTHKYKCKGNKVEIFALGSSYADVATGTVSGKTMTLEIDDETIVFTRD